MNNDRLFSFSASDIKSLGESLKKKYAVFVPRKDEKNFLKWAEGEILLNYFGNTVMPLKHHLFPQFEKLFLFKGKKGSVEFSKTEEAIEESVFWGVRPCDLKSIELLDKVFLSKEFVDLKYKEKREKTVFVAFYCLEPYQTCFCSSMQYDLADRNVSDFLFLRLNDEEYLGLVSERGEQLLAEASLNKTIASDEQLVMLNKMFEEFRGSFAIKFEMGSKPGELKDFFNDPYFADVSFKCLACGICTFVCPVCHCFAIEDNPGKDSGYRARCWDYCLNPDFTLMAGGHNPRAQKSSRIRQRFLHKGFYFKDRHDVLGCVGCGRCLMKCPVSMDICDGLLHIRGGCVKK